MSSSILPSFRGRLLRGLADIVVPPACVACGARQGSGDALCATCWRDVAFIRAPLCDRLGLPLPFGGPPPLISAAAAADPPVWARARAVGRYEPGGVLARIVSGFKYHDRHHARGLLGGWLVTAGAELLADADLIVPVALQRWRLVRRQFNQSALLAREVSRRTGVPWSPFVLAKARATVPQAGLTRQARLENVRGAFTVPTRRRSAVAGRRIVLLDDVLTTGATAEAATRALLRAGASAVDVLVVGLAPPPSSASP
jgi:ComF family protein